MAALISDDYSEKIGKADNPVGINWDGLIAIVSPSLRDAYHDGASDSAREIGSSFNQLNQKATDYARQRAAEMVGKKWIDEQLVDNPDAEWVITETTREDLKALIEQAFEDGWSPAELSQRIEELIDDPERADMISRTELAMAQESGSLEAWRESGVVAGKQWILSSAHPAEDECDDSADDGVIGLDDMFSSGDDAPPAHPACECDVIAVIEGEEGE